MLMLAIQTADMSDNVKQRLTQLNYYGGVGSILQLLQAQKFLETWSFISRDYHIHPYLNNTPKIMKSTLALVSLLAATIGCDAFSTVGIPSTATTSTTTELMMARGGRGMKKEKVPKTGGGGGMGGGSRSGGGASFDPNNWISMPASASELSTMKDGQIKLFDTNAITIKNSMTNPTAAVSVLQYNGDTYCFSHACPSCQIPMSKGKVLPATSSRPTPLLACSFCKSAYDLKTGQKQMDVTAQEIDGGGIFAGLAQSLFKSTGKTDPMPMYKLGERDGKLVVKLD